MQMIRHPATTDVRTGKATWRITCRVCKQLQPDITAPYEAYLRYYDGDLIQHALPTLSIADRELLLSATCDTCFDDLFGDDND